MDRNRLALNRWVVLGRAGIDFYAEPPGARVEEADRFFAALGGSAANVAVGIARLGGAAFLLTKISNDAVGRFVSENLRRYGVDGAYVDAVGGQARTSLAVVATRNDDTQSTIYRNGAADFALTTDDVAKVPFAEFGALIATGTALAAEPSRSAALAAASRARAQGAGVFFDVDYRPYSWSDAAEAAAVCGRLAALSDVVVGNDEEFSMLTQGGDGEAFARRLAAEGRIVIYKMGARGAKSFSGGQAWTNGVFATQAIKPTGAGDAFLAGFATGLAHGLAVDAAVVRGSGAAAIVVSRVGCAPAMPDPAELDAFLGAAAPLSFQ